MAVMAFFFIFLTWFFLRWFNSRLKLWLFALMLLGLPIVFCMGRLISDGPLRQCWVRRQLTASLFPVAYRHAALLLQLLFRRTFYSARRWEQYAWLSCSFAMACLMCVIGDSSSGALKGLVVGLRHANLYRLGLVSSYASVSLIVIVAAFFPRVSNY